MVAVSKSGFILPDMYHLWKDCRISTLKVSLSLADTYQSFLNTKEQTVNPVQPQMFLIDKDIISLLALFESSTQQCFKVLLN